MSVATSMNLAIALVDDQASVARKIFRDVSIQDIRSMATAQSRLLRSLDRRIRKEIFDELNQLLHKAMQVEMPLGGDVLCEAFVCGMKSVEDLINARMEALATELEKDTDEHPLDT